MSNTRRTGRLFCSALFLLLLLLAVVPVSSATWVPWGTGGAGPYPGGSGHGGAVLRLASPSTAPPEIAAAAGDLPADSAIRPAQVTLDVLSGAVPNPVVVEAPPPAPEADSWGEVPAAAIDPAPPAPAAGAPIPSFKVEGRPNDSGWISMEPDGQGGLYLAFEYAYASGGSCPPEGCYAVVAGKSRDNGRSWDLRYLWAADTSSARRPALTVDGSGRIYIAFEYYADIGSGLRWYPAAARSDLPREVAAWNITLWDTTYPLVPSGTAADAGGDGDDVYLMYAVPASDDGHGDMYSVRSTNGGGSWTPGTVSTNGAVEYKWPTVSVGSAYVVASYYFTSTAAFQRSIYRGSIGSLPAFPSGSVIPGRFNRPVYADADASGAYHYLVYERWISPYFYGHTYLRYSTNDWGATVDVPVDNTEPGWQLYPAVSANGAAVCVAYVNAAAGNQTYLKSSSDNGQSWSAAYDLGGATTVAALRGVGVAFHPVGGAADGRHPITVWVDSRDAGGGEGNNLYLGTINDPPSAAALAWPADGVTLTSFAPAFSWTAGSDPEGDTLRYWWFVSTTNSLLEGDKVGGPIDLLNSLPYYTDPATTYYWKVRTDDGYQVVDTAARSFTTASRVLTGAPLQYTEGFAGDPADWTRRALAGGASFESAPIPWEVEPAGKWVLAAYQGRNAVHALYDADDADYRLTSPALDLRGSAWAYFNAYFRGSSESGHDLLSLEGRPDSSAYWTVLDVRTGDQDGAWQRYYQGGVDLGAYAGSSTGQVRLRFTTNGSNYGGGYGVGWYEDDIEIVRESEWAWRNAAPYFYRLQATAGGFTGYTNNLIDEFYSPYVLLPNHAGMAIRLTLTERFEIAAGDEAAVWIRDAAAGTWQQLAAYSGSQADWAERTLPIPDGYKGRVVVLALVLRSDGAGTLGGPEEQGGYWDLDGVVVEEHGVTAVKLASFGGRPQAEGVLVLWETASEFNNAGFNLYRGAALGDLGVRLNEALIPSQAPGGDAGAAYAFRDAGAQAGMTYYYTLEDVDTLGRRTRHGPAVVTPWRVYLPVVSLARR